MAEGLLAVWGGIGLPDAGAKVRVSRRRVGKGLGRKTSDMITT